MTQDTSKQSIGDDFRVTRISVSYFRSIVQASFDLDSLTVLVGPNSSGKSNTMDILRFVKDALRFDLEAAVSKRRGFHAIRYRTRKGRPPDVKIGIEARLGTYTFFYRMVLAGDPVRDCKVKREKLTVHSTKEVYFDVRVENGRITSPGWLRSTISDHLGTDDLALKYLYGVLAGRYDVSAKNTNDVTLIAKAVRLLRFRLQRMHFVHIFPRDIREPQELGASYPLDEFGTNLASVLRRMRTRYPEAEKHLRENLRLLVPYISDVRVTATGGFLVTKLKHGEGSSNSNWFDLSQESDGTLRLLGLLTALYQRPAPSLLGIEEPEFAIHPGALTALAELLDEASLSSQILLTTHSPELMDRIPIDYLRVVGTKDRATTIERVSGQQVEAVKRKLFLPGELHRMEGLQQGNQRNS